MNEIYDNYFYKIYNWALKKTKNKEDAEDLTNNVFLAIFEYLDKNIDVKKIDNLIWKIAYNLWCTKAKNYIKEKINCEYFDEEKNLGYLIEPLDKIIYREIIDNIDNYRLSDKEKISFKLYYINDLSIEEISKKINSKEANIKYYLYCARNKIKEKYYE